MSIIADTLKRLQARSTGTMPDTPEEPLRGPGINHEEEAGRHLKSSETKLGMIPIGITMGLAGLALSAFWIGKTLDVGFSTNNHSSPTSPLPSNVQSTTDKPIKTVAAAVPAPVQPPPTPEQSANNARYQIALSEPTPEKPTVVLLLADQQPPRKKHLPTDVNHAQEADEREAINPVLATLKEEIVHTEELVKTNQLFTDSTHTPASLSMLKVGPDQIDHVVPTTVPLQSSQADRIHQGQHLIRIGKYEDAVAILSPLFHDPPVKWQPWFWMGTALLGKGDMEQADQFFLSGLARNDKVPQLWIQRALVAQQRGDYQLAIHELRQAESLEADLPHIHLNMGYAYEQLGNDRMANQYYGKFLKLSEGKPTFFSTRKKLFARLTQQTSAERPPFPSSPSSLQP